MKVIMAKLSDRETKRRRNVLAAEKMRRPKPRKHDVGAPIFVEKLNDYSGVRLKGLPKTFVGKTDKACPGCDHSGLTKWRRNGRVVAMCPRCGRTEDKGPDSKRRS